MNGIAHSRLSGGNQGATRIHAILRVGHHFCFLVCEWTERDARSASRSRLVVQSRFTDKLFKIINAIEGDELSYADTDTEEYIKDI
jgi:hypothetical protein